MGEDAALEPFAAALLKEIQRLNRSMERFERLIESQRPTVYLIREMQGDFVLGDKTVENFSSHVGDVGAHAQVVVGHHIRWGLGALSGGDALQHDFDALLRRLAEDSSLDADTQLLARAKTESVAEGLGKVGVEPQKLRLALKDAQAFFVGALSWAGSALAAILKSEPAQKTLGAVTEAATKAAVETFLGKL